MLSPNPEQPDPFLTWEVTIVNTPQKIFCEAFEDAVFIRKQDLKLGVGLTSIELEGAIAVLDWILKAGVIHAEAEHARDILVDLKLGIDGKD